MADDNGSHMPLTNARDAPRFVADDPGFDSFFEDIEDLGKRCKLDDAAKIKWAIRYAGKTAKSWRGVPCLSPDAASPATFDAFREEVREGYPNLDVHTQYTRRDLEALIERTRDVKGMDRTQLGDYYREFNTYADYLIGKRTFSDIDKASAYLRGFPQSIRVEIASRLKITKPHVLPADGYPFRDIHDAARFVLAGGTQDAFGDSDNAPPRSDARDQKFERLMLAVTDLTHVVATSSAQSHRRSSSSPSPPYSRPSGPSPTPGGVDQNPPRWGPPPQSSQSSQDCMFCSGRDHYVRDCPIASQYLQQGKVVRNDVGRLVLPDGRYVPRSTPGRNMRERVDNLRASSGNQRRDGGNNDPVSTHFLEGPDEYIFSFDVSNAHEESSPISPEEAAVLEEINVMQARANSLREQRTLALQKAGKRPQQFDGVEVPRRVGPPKRDGVRDPPPHQAPNIYAPPNVRNRLQRSSSSSSPPSNGANGKSGARAGDVPLPPSRPQGPMRPIEMPPKPSDDHKLRYQAPVEADVKATDLVDRALDAKITISTRELLATSSEVRKHVKDMVTNKKVSANVFERDDVDSFVAEFLDQSADVDSESASTYLDFSKYEPQSPSAVISLPLRVIYPSFGPDVEPECILDGGAQIVVMRKDVWQKLRAPIISDRPMVMESASAGTTKTLGVLEEHPVQLGPITVYLQIQVVENAPFEVLLGRPFFDVISCAEDSRSGGHHQIHVTDPRTGRPYTFPTHPRPPKALRNSSKAAVNFRR